MDASTKDFFKRLSAHTEVLKNLEAEEARAKALYIAGVQAMKVASGEHGLNPKSSHTLPFVRSN